jgi:hypothetical protein
LHNFGLQLKIFQWLPAREISTSGWSASAAMSFDSAEAYGPFDEVLGEAVAGFRDPIIIATKFCFRDGDPRAGFEQPCTHPGREPPSASENEKFL